MHFHFMKTNTTMRCAYFRMYLLVDVVLVVGWEWILLPRRQLFGLLHQPRMMGDEWNKWQGKLKYLEKTCPSATLSSINPSWPDLGSNPSHRIGKPATNVWALLDAALPCVLMFCRCMGLPSSYVFFNFLLGFCGCWKKLTVSYAFYGNILTSETHTKNRQPCYRL
jgi:hypothetical protein